MSYVLIFLAGLLICLLLVGAAAALDLFAATHSVGGPEFDPEQIGSGLGVRARVRGLNQLTAEDTDADIRLNFGPTSLKDMYCETRGEEAPHIRGECGHCARQPRNSDSDRRGSGGGPPASKKSARPWREDHEIMCEAPRHPKPRKH